MMKKKLSYSLRTLPPEVQHIVFQERNADINHTIAQAYALTPQQLNLILQVLVEIITKNLETNQFLVKLEEIGLAEDLAKKVALDFAYLRLWPLRSWLKGVENLIKFLGGTVPKIK